MIDLTDIEYVKGLQMNLRASLESESGKEVLKFMEELCGWYDLNAKETNDILIAHGKRQVYATLRTLLDFKPEQVVAVAQPKEN
jgi:hypothetical protein